MRPKPQPKSALPTRYDFDLLIKQANTGDETAVAKLQSLLNECPELWHSVGDLAQAALVALAKGIAQDNELFFQSLLKSLAELEDTLVGPSASALERLAIQRILATYIECQHTTLNGPELSGSTLKQAKFALQVRESADRRFQAAIKGLTLVRRMQRDDATAYQGPRETKPPNQKGNGSPVNRLTFPQNQSDGWPNRQDRPDLQLVGTATKTK